MKAILLEAPGQFKRVEVAGPLKPGPGEALVRVHRVGICGTDISGYLGKMPFFSYPAHPRPRAGRRGASRSATAWRTSSPATAAPSSRTSTARQCYACRRGHTNCCEKHQTLGVHSDGGMRPRFLVPARKLHVSRKLGFEQLALVETLAIGCHAVDRAAPQPDESCLIIGAGPIGLATLEFVKLTGAKIIVLDMNAAAARVLPPRDGRGAHAAGLRPAREQTCAT